MNLSPKKSLLTVRLAVRVVVLAALAVGAVAVPACSSADDSASSSTATMSKDLKVSGVWARQVMDTGAVYMTITGGADADALTKVEVPSDVAAGAHLHETMMSDMSTTDMSGSDMSGSMGGSGTMSMDQVQKVEVPAGEVVRLKPGGFHVMLMGVKQQLKAGETFPVTLTFEKAGIKKVTATVKGL